jgi:hypothetical protein
MPVPPSRGRAAGAYVPAYGRGAITRTCPRCGALPYYRCYRMVGEQQVMLNRPHAERRGNLPEAPPQE